MLHCVLHTLQDNVIASNQSVVNLGSLMYFCHHIGSHHNIESNESIVHSVDQQVKCQKPTFFDWVGHSWQQMSLLFTTRLYNFTFLWNIYDHLWLIWHCSTASWTQYWVLALTPMWYVTPQQYLATSLSYRCNFVQTTPLVHHISMKGSWRHVL